MYYVLCGSVVEYTKSIMQFMFSTVYRVTQKDFYARPYMRMRDLRHNSNNDGLELITPHVLINTWQELEYRKLFLFG